MGLVEGLLESVGETDLAGGTLGLLGLSSLGSLVLEENGTGILAGLGSDDLVGTLGAGEGVKLLHHVAVLEGVLLGLLVEDNGSLDGIEFALDLIGVNDSGKIGAINGVTHKLVSVLLNSLGGVGTEDLVKSIEGILSVDHESTEVTTRSELEQVKGIDAASVHTGEVPGNTLEVVVGFVVDNKGSLAHGEAGVTILALAGTRFLRFADAVEVGSGTELFHHGEERLGVVGVEATCDKGQFRDIHNAVTTGKDERGAG